jgi:hypothetical protein
MNRRVDPKYVVYGESPGGPENSVLRIMETASGRDLGKAIDRTQYSSPQWRPDVANRSSTGASKSGSGAAPKTRHLNSRAYLLKARRVGARTLGRRRDTGS